ncbi:hypothetical protein Tco_0835993 [Tanacetum coccineum]
MLEKGSYDTWQSRMLMYIEGKDNGKFFLNFVLSGPFQLKEITIPANEETGQEEEKKMQTMDEFVTLHKISQPGSSYDVALSEELRRSSYVARVPSKSWKSYGVTHRQSCDQLYDYHKQNQDDANEIRAEHAMRYQDLPALVANTNNPPQLFHQVPYAQ